MLRDLTTSLFFAMVAGSLLWTLRLLVLTVDPKDTTNRVMDTGTYDGGSFCLLVEPALSFVLFGVAGLVLVGSGHGYLLLKIARVRTLASIRVTSTSSRTANSSRVDSIARRVSGIRATLRGLVARAADDSVRSFVVKSVAKLTTDNLAFADSDARKKAVAAPCTHSHTQIIADSLSLSADCGCELAAPPREARGHFDPVRAAAAEPGDQVPDPAHPRLHDNALNVQLRPRQVRCQRRNVPRRPLRVLGSDFS